MLRVPYALSVYDDEEIQAVVAVLKEHRSNMGIETQKFENSVAKLFGKKYGVMVNSGSSANLLAIKLLNLPKGSEVITPLLTFSTTIAPLVQHGLVPVFVDVLPGKYVIDVDQVESLICKKTKALMIPLIQGNVPQMNKLQQIAKKYNLIFIEDSCDAIGAMYNGKPTASYSDITTTSFFGSHIITAGGNGGMILCNSKQWMDKIKILRGWGRSSALFSESEDINKRFQGRIDDMPYDAKFIFQEVGYNFLPNEMCAAFGNKQLDKLNKFRKIREKNFIELKNFFKKYEDIFILPQQDKSVSTQWITFPLTIKKNALFTRFELVTYLEMNNIQTRPIFSGNILRQPGFKNIPHKTSGRGYQVTDEIMDRGFVIGCHQGLEKNHLDRLKDVFISFLKQKLL